MIPPPVERDGVTAIYDPVRNRMLVLCGRGRGYLNDVWALPLGGESVWSPLGTTGTPPPGRYDHTAIYDPVGDRVIVFGGDVGSSYANDVWALALGGGTPTWSQLAPGGVPPSGRQGHTAIYDPVRQRMVVFGGDQLNPFLRLNDVWALSLSGPPVWTQLAPSGTLPGGRANPAVIYDTARDRMIVFGGFGTTGTYLNDLWSLSFSGTPAWAPLAPGGPPVGRFGHQAIYDASRDRMVVFGGRTSGSLFPNDAWVLNLSGSTSWLQLYPAGTPPAGRMLHGAIYDPNLDRMLVFGGLVGSSGDNDLWGLSLSGATTWSEAYAPGNPPGRRGYHAAILDPVRHRMVVFGGHDGVGGVNTLPTLALDGAPLWSFITAAGTPPPPRWGHSAIYDPVRDRMVVFGGYDGGYRNDVWVLTLAGSPTWTQLTPAGVPPSPRQNHTAIYDPIRDRMIVFGGIDPTRRNDLFELTLGDNPTWSPIAAAGTPPTARYGHSTIYDPIRDRMLIFGGYDGAFRNDLWELALAGSPAWSALTPSGTPPFSDLYRIAVYDPLRDRMVVFGGWGASSGSNFTWALALAPGPAWAQLAPGGPLPPGRFGHTMIYDPAADRMVVFGAQPGPLGDTWALTWGATVGVPAPSGTQAASGILRVEPNPSRGAVAFVMSLGPGEPKRSVEVFDLRGHRVWRADVDPRAGSRMVWDGRRDGTPLPTGVYFARLAGAPMSSARRFILLH